MKTMDQNLRTAGRILSVFLAVSLFFQNPHAFAETAKRRRAAPNRGEGQAMGSPSGNMGQGFQRQNGRGPLGRVDRDNNPPGMAGGPGTNWENPPGPAGGPGASPNQGAGFQAMKNRADANQDGTVDQTERRQARQEFLKNHPGMREKMKAKMDQNQDGTIEPQERAKAREMMRKRRQQNAGSNPPGMAGGPGTNWENPPGPAGGPGASPNRPMRRYRGQESGENTADTQ